MQQSSDRNSQSVRLAVKDFQVEPCPNKSSQVADSYTRGIIPHTRPQNATKILFRRRNLNVVAAGRDEERSLYTAWLNTYGVLRVKKLSS